MGAKSDKKRVVEVVDRGVSAYEGELEEDVSIDASAEAVARAVMGSVEVRVVSRGR